MTLHRNLYVKSRSPVFLWLMAIGIVAGGALLGSTLRWSGITGKTDAQETAQQLLRLSSEYSLEGFEEFLKENPENPYEVLPLTQKLATLTFIKEADFQAVLDRRIQDEGQKRVLALSFLAGKHKAHLENLRKLADTEPPVPLASFALALYLQPDDAGTAYQYFKREAQFEDADKARKNVIRYVLAERNITELEIILSDERYAKNLSGRERFAIACLQNQWLKAMLLFREATYADVPPGIFALAAVSGLLWFLFLIQGIQPTVSEGKRKLFLCCLAVALGIFSIPPTILIVAIEESYGFVQRQDLFGGIIYFVLGVGLREELMKCLLFTPLLFFLREGKDQEALILGACVGLGFAVEENVGYYHSYGEMAAPGRFLTANFFHMAATGIIGLQLFRAVRYHGMWNDFLNTFFTVVVIHGIYDALMGVPGLSEFSWLSITAFIYLCYLFFHEYRSLRQPGREIISLTGTLAFAVSMIFSATLVFLCAKVPLAIAIALVGFELMNSAILVYMFLREVPESLIR